jgi:hypothetical protein
MRQQEQEQEEGKEVEEEAVEGVEEEEEKEKEDARDEEERGGKATRIQTAAPRETRHLLSTHDTRTGHLSSLPTATSCWQSSALKSGWLSCGDSAKAAGSRPSHGGAGACVSRLLCAAGTRGARASPPPDPHPNPPCSAVAVCANHMHRTCLPGAQDAD